ncbi:MAG: hypothetical protein KDD46_07700 [Bdellovibrionales bacterium]|nr:hypothetical protein [Bdellovibrionales bacterium]
MPIIVWEDIDGVRRIYRSTKQEDESWSAAYDMTLPTGEDSSLHGVTQNQCGATSILWSMENPDGYPQLMMSQYR